ncbi:helix-turn-helix transcriptional regulator [Humitalea sp. 24SJ18S-53]|uniref:helix-turn-helix transcriptional regulator n=1 Tax=Humitalea sp. 24SJ18S-53 TaxID=3422307 RepID=UPI003D67B284
MHDISSVHAPQARRRDRAFLTQAELAYRWRLSERTLEKWRQQRIGPRHLRIGGRVRYPADEVERYEAAQLRGGAR